MSSYSPKDLLLIRDKKHPLFDARVEWEPDMELVYEMIRDGGMSFGRVELVKTPEGPAVVIGQGRTIAAQKTCEVLAEPENEAHKKILEAAYPEGVPDKLPKPFKIEAEFRPEGESNAATYRAKFVENNRRRNDPPVMQARKIKHYVDLRMEELGPSASKSAKRALTKEAAGLWGKDVDTVKLYLNVITKASKETRRRLDAGELSWRQAIKIVAQGATEEEQDERGKTEKSSEKGADGKIKPKRNKNITPRRAERVLELLGDGHEFAPVLKWFAGKLSSKKFYELVKIKEADI